MYTTEIEKIKAQLSNALTDIDPIFIDALLLLHKRLSRQNIHWAIWGDLGEALKTVSVAPDCIEIVTTKKGAVQIFLAVQDLSPTGVFFQTHKLPRKAEVDGNEYPVYLRSHYFEFTLNGIKVKVYGDLQYRISNWAWGDRVEFNPDHIFVAGMKTALVPLAMKHDFYEQLGWADRAEKVKQVLMSPHR